MIHPQYIVGIFDSNHGKFEIKKYKKCFKFRILIFSKNIQVLYKIKERFRVGKVRKLDDTNVLIMDKNLNKILDFFYKNQLLTRKSIEFHKFAYLYQKLIIESNEKSEKEIRKIINRLSYFLL
ncbi:MAG: LAGLIDADG family homing endonuclease [bacterium]